MRDASAIASGEPCAEYSPYKMLLEDIIGVKEDIIRIKTSYASRHHTHQDTIRIKEDIIAIKEDITGTKTAIAIANTIGFPDWVIPVLLVKQCNS
jgi:hypothetical protein